MSIINFNFKKLSRIERVHILYVIISIFFIMQTIELMNYVGYKKMIVDITMICITAMLLVVVGYFLLS